MTGDLQGLLDVLAPDVVLVADGGGIAPAILKPLTGIRPIANLLSNFKRLLPDLEVETVWVNGGPAARIDGGEKRRRDRHQRRHRGRADHAHLCHAEPAQARAHRCDGRAAAVSGRLGVE